MPGFHRVEVPSIAGDLHRSPFEPRLGALSRLAGQDRCRTCSSWSG